MATNWTGNVNNFWDESGNWDNGIPGTLGAEDVVIAGSPLTQLRSLSGTVTINSLNATGRLDLLTIATLRISTTGTLQNFLQSGGNLEGAGTVNIFGTTQWISGLQSGSGTTNFEGVLRLGVGGTSPRANIDDKRTLNINAGAVWDSPQAGFLDTAGSPVINNNSGSVFDIRNDSGSNGSFSTLSRIGGTGGTLNNQSGATFQKSGGTGTFLIKTGFNNDGVTRVDSGTLRLGGGGTHTGSFSGQGSLEFSGGTHRLITGSQVNAENVVASGVLNIELENKALFNTVNTNIKNGTFSVLGADNQAATGSLTQSNGAIAGEGDFIVNGPFNWLGGSHNGTGTTVVNGLLTLDGTNHFLGAFGSGETRTLELNGGAVLISTSANIAVSDGAAINNNVGSIFDIQTDNGSLNNSNRIGAGLNTGVFNNQAGATVLKSGGSGALIFGTEFSNSGVVEVQSGRLSFSKLITQSAGEFRLNGGDFGFIGTQRLTLAGGEVTGAGILDGAIENRGGTLTPGLAVGDIGTLQITENYSETDAAEIVIDIGSMGHDAIAIDGQAILDGTLTVNLVNGFTPMPGQEFEVVTFAAGTDIAAAAANLTFVGLDIEPGLALNPIFDTNGLTLVVDEVISDDIRPNVAPAHQLDFDSSIFRQIGEDIDGENSGDFSGGSVSLSASGHIIAIGSTGNDGNGTDSGHVRIYQNIDDNWVQVGEDIDGENENDGFGYIVSLSADGKKVAVGAGGLDDNSYVRIYQNIDSRWQQVGAGIEFENDFGLFGFSVSLSEDGNAVAIGVPDGNGNNSGDARVYQNIDASWRQIGEDIEGAALGDFSGSSVSLSEDGNIIAISAPSNDGDESTIDYVRIYQNIEGNWLQIGDDLEGDSSNNFSSESVSLSAEGNIVATSSLIPGTRNIQVRIYQNINGSWRQIGETIDGEILGDSFGGSVSLSSDGNRVAIGAPGSDRNGVASGQVHIYQNIDGSWQQIGETIDGEAIGDGSGGSASLAGEGDVIAIGASNNDGNGTDSGHARVFARLPHITVDEDTLINLTELQVDDVDGNLLETQLTVINGRLTVNPTDGVTISNGANNSETLKLQGTQAEINTVLSTLTYQGNLDFNGDDTLSLTSTDAEGLTDTDAIAITVLPVDDPINLEFDTRSISENGGSAEGTVSLESSKPNDVVITLTSGDRDKISLPTTVTIPTGETSVTFKVTGIDNAIASGNQDLSIGASADGFAEESAILRLVDDEELSLSLTVDNASLSENGGTTLGTVTRNTDTVGTVTVNLNSSDNTEAIVPDTVTIQPGRNSARFLIEGIDDPIADGTQTVSITAKAPGFRGNQVLLDVIDDETPVLTFVLDLRSISENNGIAQGSITRNTEMVGDLSLKLSSSDTSEALVPETIVILDGQDAITFPIKAVDDATADGFQDVTLTAIADGFPLASVPLRVTDDEISTLTVLIDLEGISENRGVATGTVTRNTENTENLLVQLQVDDLSEAFVPALVVIPRGQDSVNFSITGVDDAIADGNQLVTITATANRLVDDDFQIPDLSLSLSQLSLSENGEVAIGTVTRTTSVIGDLEITLMVDDASEASVPTTVIIPDGQSSVSFEITGIDDALVDRTKAVSIQASADGLDSVTTLFEVLDDDAIEPPIIDQSVRQFPLRDDQRWIRTATNNVALGQGDPTTVTWSVIPDGTGISQRPSFNEQGDSQLQQRLTDIYGSQETWLPIVASTFDRWSHLSGLNLIYEINDDSASVGFPLEPGIIGTRGDIRIGGLPLLLQVNGALFAYSYRDSDSGATVVGTNGNLTTNNNSIFFRSALARQIGLILGLTTLESEDANFLLDGRGISLNGSQIFDGPQLDEILSIQRLYGDALESFNGLPTESNDAISSATNLGQLNDGDAIVIGSDASDTSTVVTPDQRDFVSIDDDSDIDFYRFTLDTKSSVEIDLTPRGPTYQQGFDSRLSSSTQTSLNTKALSDLSLALFWNGELLAVENETLIGEAERIALELEPGTYFTRVKGGHNNIQLYELSLLATAIEGSSDGSIPPFSEGSDTVVVLDDEIPTLSLTITPNQLSENAGQAIGTVSRNTDTAENLLVTLSVDDASEVFAPAQVIIPRGQESVDFTLTGIDDAIADGDQLATITAMAERFVDATFQIPDLNLSIDQLSLSENGGVATGTITRTISITGDLEITLTVDDESEASVPTTVIIPDGQASANFSITGLDDAIADGNQVVTIEATATGLSGVSARFEVSDDDRIEPPVTLLDTQNPNNFPEIREFNQVDGHRWSRTATNPPGLIQGDPTTLTWSVVPDGTRIDASGATSAGPSQLQTRLNTVYGNQETWLPIFESVFESWGNKSGLNFVFETNDDGADFGEESSSFAPGVLGTRGDIRLGGLPLIGMGISTPLAYNLMPDDGDGVINTSFNFGTNNQSQRFRNVLTHELGHALGLFHVESSSDSFQLEPSGGGNFDGPQIDEILSIQRLYGDALESSNGLPDQSNDEISSATDLGGLNIGESITIGTDASDTSTVVMPDQTDFVSIDDDSDIDFYRFTLDTTSRVEINLDPRGPSYQQGYQEPLIGPGPIQTTINTKSLSDLSLALFREDALLTVANEAAIGAGERLTLELNPGTYYTRVTGNENNIQLYELSLSATGLDRDTETPTVSFLDGQDSVLVLDDEDPELTLTISPESFSENGGTAQGTLSRRPGTNGDLVVTLFSNDTTEATVPTSVTILDGQASATFTITGVDDDLFDDDQQVEIEASAAGFTSAMGRIEVINDDVRPNTAPIHSLDVGSLPLTQIGQDIDGETPGDNSGRSVSLSADGTILAIGAFRNDGNGADSGHVRVYQKIEGDWQQLGQDIDGENSGDRSGRSVSLSADGKILAIGANLNDGNGVNSGHVRVYQIIEDTWLQMGQDINGENGNDRAGFSVSLSADGSTLAIGAPENDDNGRSSGHVRVYQNIDGSLQQIGDDIDGETIDDDSGLSISLSADGRTLAIGARFNDGNGTSSGHVRIYQNIADTWQQIGQDIDGENPGDQSGFSVSLSGDGNTFAVGARSNNENGRFSGHVRVYQNMGGDWQQIGEDIDGANEGDGSGTSVSLSADGNILAIGATANDDNGAGSGHVRVYQNIAGNWQQIGPDILGETAGDRSGDLISLSADGNTIAIGATGNDGNGVNSGHVRVFSIFPNITTPEDIPIAIEGIQVDDINDNLVSTQLSVLNGFLTLDLSNGVTIAAGSNTTASLTLQGTQTAINETLTTLIYQGNQDFNGSDRLTILSTDEEGLTDLDAIAITVTPVDDPLTLTIDTPRISENGGVTQGTVSRGLQTSRDLVVTLSNGNNSKLSVPDTVTILDGQSSTSFDITALDNAIADGDQTVQISAAAIDFTEATVALEIIDDETLTANDDERTTNEDTAIAIVPSTNDISPGSGLLIQSIETTDTQGLATLNAEQTAVLYDPNNAFEDLTTGETRTDTFTYTVTDGTGLIDTATVSITVEGVNDAPVASDDIVTTEIETAITIDVAANDSDIDGDLDFNSREITNGSTLGFLIPRLDGSGRVYLPASFLLSPNLEGLLANAGIDLNTLDISNLSTTNGPANGLLVLPTDTSDINYVPLPNFLGTDTFSYAIADDEGAQSNDAVVTVNVIPSNALSLNLDPVSISENGGLATGQVRLTEAVADNLQVTLTTSDESEITLPESVIILAGETSTTFSVTGLNDNTIDGTQVLRISASAEAVIGAEAILDVTDDDVPALSLVIDRDRISENNDAARGILSRNTETIGDLVVNLSSSDTTEASVNATVTIPDGEKTVVFAIEGVDDAIADGPQSVTIKTQTAGFTDATKILVVTDDEVPALEFTIEAPSISENGGVTRGIITRNTDPSDSLVVTVGGEASDEVSFPSTVTIPAGQRSASFLISANDDAIADGNQSLSISANASGLIGAFNSITVTDDEVPTLSIAIPRPRLREKGESNLGTVFRNTVIGGGLPIDLGNTPLNTDDLFGNSSSNNSQDLIVTLTSSDTNEAIVPETVVIPAGQSSATFEIRPGDDLILDGPQQATITASAPGFVSGQNQVSVADNETLETIDGNDDGIPDGNQDNVVSLLQLDNSNSEGDILTLSGPDNIVLRNAGISPNPAPDAPDNPSLVADFPIGYLSFEIENVTIGEPLTLRLQLPDQLNKEEVDINTYWKFGPTPDNPVDHWYEFLFDGTTGAEFFDIDNDGLTDEILLHFLDGQRGDSDIIKNGIILDPGSPGIITNQAPIADDESYTTTLFNAPLQVNAQTGVLNGDTDADGKSLTSILDTSTTQGTIQLDEDGSFTYTPKVGFSGIDSFTYTAFDGLQSSDPAQVSITVEALPSAPANAIQGTHTSEKLRGTKGNDFLVGLGGGDRLYGRRGNDTLSGGVGADLVKGKKGNDLIDGGADNDVLKGGKGNDRIFGDAGDDFLKGQKGNDLLIGGEGNDVIKGNKGDDTLIGGEGNDVLRGGGGADLYVLSPNAGRDRFEKFKLGVDKIALADGLTFGALTFQSQQKSVHILLETETLAVVDTRGRGRLGEISHFEPYEIIQE